jgi:hypothetical protein
MGFRWLGKSDAEQAHFRAGKAPKRRERRRGEQRKLGAKPETRNQKAGRYWEAVTQAGRRTRRHALQPAGAQRQKAINGAKLQLSKTPLGLCPSSLNRFFAR